MRAFIITILCVEVISVLTSVHRLTNSDYPRTRVVKIGEDACTLILAIAFIFSAAILLYQ